MAVQILNEEAIWSQVNSDLANAAEIHAAPDAVYRDAAAATGQASASGQPNGPSEVGADCSITISGGLATFPWDGATVDALLTRADQALLAAKRAGKNRIFTVS